MSIVCSFLCKRQGNKIYIYFSSVGNTQKGNKGNNGIVCFQDMGKTEGERTEKNQEMRVSSLLYGSDFWNYFNVSHIQRRNK